MRELVKRHGFVEAELKRVFRKAQRAQPVLEAISRPAERVRTWEEYRSALLTERRVNEGLEFWKKYRNTLERAEKKYGVPPEYVVAIIGVETFYGRNTGNWRVVDALTTLAFDYPPRAGFFRNELEQYLLFARAAGRRCVLGARARTPAPSACRSSCRAARAPTPSILTATGASTCRKGVSTRSAAWRISSRSTAGNATRTCCSTRASPATPGGRSPKACEPKHSLLALREAGIEFDSPQPAGAQVVLVELASAERPSDFRVALRNFYVITRYNRSAFYAAAVADLARALRKSYDFGR